MKVMKNQLVNKIVRASAVYYANVTCPLFTYQPKVGTGIKNLRKNKKVRCVDK